MVLLPQLRAILCLAIEVRNDVHGSARLKCQTSYVIVGGYHQFQQHHNFHVHEFSIAFLQKLQLNKVLDFRRWGRSSSVILRRGKIGRLQVRHHGKRKGTKSPFLYVSTSFSVGKTRNINIVAGSTRKTQISFSIFLANYSTSWEEMDEAVANLALLVSMYSSSTIQAKTTSVAGCSID